MSARHPTPRAPGTIRNAHGERLAAAFKPGRPGDDRLVVIGHGLTSQHDRPWLCAVADTLAAAGIASLRFSFAGNGGSEGRFVDATITKEVGDLGAVLDALPGWRIAYAGHSMGAAVGVLRAAADARIRALVSLAGMVHVAAFVERWLGHLVPGRDVMFDKPHCPLGRAFLDDACRIGSVVDTAARLTMPWLLVHGDRDEMVPLRDAQDAHAAAAAAGARPELVVLPGHDHRFAPRVDDMASTVQRWLTTSFAADARPADRSAHGAAG